MIDQKIITNAAYAMQEAYVNSDTIPQAVKKVSKNDKFKDIPEEMLTAMCLSIDAYVDINCTCY